MFKLLTLFLICDSVLSYSIPPYVHLCKRNDPNMSQCLINTVNQMKPYLKTGIPEMNLPSIEPFHIDNVNVSNYNQYAPINLNLYNGTVDNMSNFQISQITIDLDKGKFSATTNFPNLKLASQYKLKGQLMIFNLDGVGSLIFNLDNVTTYTDWYGTFYTKGGSQYLKFDHGNSTSKVGNMTTRIDDLFKNNQLLTDNFNQVMNSNMDVLSEELNPLVDQTINSLSMQYFNDVFDQFPIDVLFPRT